jgi:hypothetical protein
MKGDDCYVYFLDAPEVNRIKIGCASDPAARVAPTTFRTCEPCYDLRVWVKNNVPCLCIMHDNMDEEMTIAVDEARYRAPEETVGLKFGFLRRKVLRQRIKRRKKAA